MKAPKILVAGLLAFSIAGVSHAQTVIRITGSTAFRAGTQQAVLDILQPATTTIGYVGSSYYGCNESIVTGTTLSNSYPVIIKAFWSGSVGGVQTVSQQLVLANAWLTNGSPASAAPGTPISSGSAGFESPGNVPDACMSDVFQSTTPFPTPALYPQPNGNIVGIVCFKWVRNNGSPSTWSNMTPQLANALYGASGSLPLSLFTGLASDAGTNVYAMGRSADSGTRMAAFTETGVGAFATVQQYYATNAGGIIKSTGQTITGQELVPVDTVNGITYPAGDSGYSSGGQLADGMGASGSATASGVKGFYVTYLGLPDAFTAENLGASDLTYNGVPYSTNAVQNGQYTFWSYEHLYYRQGFSGIPLTVVNYIANEITTRDAAYVASGVAPGILLPYMNVGRTTDGAPVFNGNPYAP